MTNFGVQYIFAGVVEDDILNDYYVTKENNGIHFINLSENAMEES